MLPNPRIFRSRWAALLWAGGILWFAYDVSNAAPSNHATANAATITDADGDPANIADLQAVANLIEN